MCLQSLGKGREDCATNALLVAALILCRWKLTRHDRIGDVEQTVALDHWQMLNGNVHVCSIQRSIYQARGS